MIDGRRPGHPRGFFAPKAEEHNYLAFGGRVGLPRLVLRIVIAVALLAAVDVAVGRTLAPDSVYLHAYRLPRKLPTASLPDYVASIDASARTRQGGPIVVFLGASPTYGHRTKDAANTYPYAFQASADASGWPSRTFNLASNGQFLADEYVIGKRLADDADVVFVQLTYHTFNPKARAGVAIRYPELPKLLGVRLNTPEATLLGVKPSATDAAVSRADAAVGRYWLLWRERDALNQRLFGGKPQSLLTRSAASPASRLSPVAEPADDGFTSFESLDPGRQMIVISRYAENASFEIEPIGSEVRFLRALAGELAAKHKKAVFFVAPLNRQLIEEYELIDPEQYASNVAVLRGVAERDGFPFLDYNVGPDVLGSELFADISHTTDEGGKRVGALLWRDSAAYLEAVGTP